MSMTEKEIEFLHKNPFFKDLTDEDFSNLCTLFIRKEFSPGDSILEEGEISTEMFFIVEGECSVLKWDEDHNFKIPIALVKSGELVGEISLFADAPYSNSIEALQSTVTYSLHTDAIQSLPNHEEIYRQIRETMFWEDYKRLMAANVAHVGAIRAPMKILKQKTERSNLLLQVIGLLGILNILFLSLLYYFPEMRPAKANLYFLYWLVAIFCLFILLWRHHLHPLAGVQKEKENPEVLKNSLMTSFVLCAVCLIAYPLIPSPETQIGAVSMTLLSASLYIVYSFIYEFIARVILQNSIQEILTDVRGIYSAAITALLMTVLPFVWYQFSLIQISLSFAASFFLGLFYQRYHSLLGVWMIHGSVGLWIRFLFGVT